MRLGESSPADSKAPLIHASRSRVVQVDRCEGIARVYAHKPRGEGKHRTLSRVLVPIHPCAHPKAGGDILLSTIHSTPNPFVFGLSEIIIKKMDLPGIQHAKRRLVA